MAKSPALPRPEEGDGRGRGRRGRIGSGVAGRDGRRRAEAPAAGTAEAEAELAVDDVLEARLQVGDDRRALCRRDASRGHLLVEIGPRCLHERVDETGGALALRPRDLGQRVTVLDLRAYLRLGQPEILGRSREVDEAVVAAAVADAKAEPAEWYVSCLDPLLELSRLG